MIFYDIKSLTWYPTISWTVCETRIFFADFRGENYNRNTTKRKTITFVKRESNLFNSKRGEKYNFAPKLEAATLAGARVNFTDSAETILVSKWSRIFQTKNSKQKN